MSARFKLILKLVVSASLLVYLVSSMDGAQVRRVLATVSPTLVALAVLIHFVTVSLSLLRWRTVVVSFGIGASLGRLFHVMLVGYGFNLVLPTGLGGDAVRAYYLAQLEDEWLPTTLMTTFLDRFFGLFGLILVGTVAVLIEPIPIHGRSLLPLFLALLGGFLVGALVLFDRRTQRIVSGLLERVGRAQLAGKVGAVADALQKLRGSPAALIRVVGISVVIQLVVIVTSWVAAMSLNLDAPLRVFATFLPVINLTMVFPLTINGLGVREAAYYLLFSQIGVPIEEAVLLSLLTFLIMNVPSVIGAVVYAFSKFEPAASSLEHEG
jgi:uncharacterized protein (TIRG00374 family)